MCPSRGTPAELRSRQTRADFRWPHVRTLRWPRAVGARSHCRDFRRPRLWQSSKQPVLGMPSSWGVREFSCRYLGSLTCRSTTLHGFHLTAHIGTKQNGVLPFEEELAESQQDLSTTMQQGRLGRLVGSARTGLCQAELAFATARRGGFYKVADRLSCGQRLHPCGGRRGRTCSSRCSQARARAGSGCAAKIDLQELEAAAQMLTSCRQRRSITTVVPSVADIAPAPPCCTYAISYARLTSCTDSVVRLAGALAGCEREQRRLRRRVKRTHPPTPLFPLWPWRPGNGYPETAGPGAAARPRWGDMCFGRGGRP